MPSEIFINTFSFSIIQNFFIKKWIIERPALPLCTFRSKKVLLDGPKGNQRSTARKGKVKVNRPLVYTAIMDHREPHSMLNSKH